MPGHAALVASGFAAARYPAYAADASRFIRVAEMPTDMRAGAKRSAELLARYPKDPMAHLLRSVHLLEEKHLGEAARASLLRHAWPGNVRELKNIMQRAKLLAAKETITPADLGLPEAPAAPAPASGGGDAEPDREAIEQALARAGGTIAQAAAELGLSRQALYRRMDRLGISRPAG